MMMCFEEQESLVNGRRVRLNQVEVPKHFAREFDDGFMRKAIGEKRVGITNDER